MENSNNSSWPSPLNHNLGEEEMVLVSEVESRRPTRQILTVGPGLESQVTHARAVYFFFRIRNRIAQRTGKATGSENVCRGNRKARC